MLTEIRTNVHASLVGLLWVGLALAGCQSEAARSLPGLEAWLARIEEFYHRHQRWPDRLDDLGECFAREEDFHQALYNPVTGQPTGYEYVKPPDWIRDTPLADRVVILYQLRAEGRAEDLPVGYLNGRAGLLQPQDITQTAANWQPFQPPEAPVEVAFPTPPARDPQPPIESPPDSADEHASSQTPQPTSQQPGPALSAGMKGSELWSYRANFCGLQYMLFGMRSALFYQAAQENPYQLLERLSASLTETRQAHIRRQEQLRLQNYPALDVELALPEQRHQFRVRWCLVGDRLYCLCVVGPDGTLNKATAEPFFHSFRVLVP